MSGTTSPGDSFANLPTLERVIEDIFTLDDFRTKLATGKKLRIKYGVDVTAPFLHIGHAVNLWAMRELQEQGHKVVFLIGDFTTRIGDPTGKSQTRPQVDQNQIQRDAQGFIEQVSQILLTDSTVFEVRRNSEWWNSMPLERFTELLSLVTHAQLIQRDMFQQRIARGVEIHLHELLYPVLQGYDSHALESDVTIVGSEQLFNELMGRFYQERLGSSPQTVITTKITPGIDGKAKQSKSLGNYVALCDSSRDKFGKIMSLPDHLIVDFLRVYTLVSLDEIEQIDVALNKGALNPRDAKRLLAQAIVERYHGKGLAEAEDQHFTQVFSRRAIPKDIPIVEIAHPSFSVLEVIKICVPEKSTNEIRRLLGQGGIRVNNTNTLADPRQRHVIRAGDVISIGKRQWFRIVFSADH